MTTVVFCGPTLSHGEALALLPDARVLPPASQGDVLREGRYNPSNIVLIDGYFEGVPSVWHKEILWALDRGIRVLGASSMGALRATELVEFGMVGFGVVFRLFADGELEDDDEVAVTHGPSELGFPACSEAMVNIRATLASAEQQCILSGSARAALEAAAKSLFFPDRTLEKIIEQAPSSVSAVERESLAGWWNEGRVDLKKQDAIGLLTWLRQNPYQPLADDKVRAWQFEPTLHWQQLANSVANAVHKVESKSRQSRLQAPHRETTTPLPRFDSFARFIQSAAAARGVSVPAADYARVAERVCCSAHLQQPSDVNAWLSAQGYSLDEFRVLIHWVAALQKLLEAGE